MKTVRDEAAPPSTADEVEMVDWLQEKRAGHDAPVEMADWFCGRLQEAPSVSCSRRQPCLMSAFQDYQQNHRDDFLVLLTHGLVDVSTGWAKASPKGERFLQALHARNEMTDTKRAAKLAKIERGTSPS